MLQDLHIDREFAADSEEFEIQNVLEMNKRIGQVYTWTPTFILLFVLRKVHSLFQSEVSTKQNLVLTLSISSILSFH